MDYAPHPSPITSQQQSMQEARYSQLLQADRESEGRCGLCGVQTHRLCYRDTVVGNMLCKEPLDVEGEVHRGRCLLCHPLPPSVAQMQVPQMELDCMTVNSGATASSVSAASACSYCYDVAPQQIMMGSNTNTSPNQIYDFPYMMAPQQQYINMLPPLPLPTASRTQSGGMSQLQMYPQRQFPQEPSMATIQSLPTADITTILSLMRMHSHNSVLIATALQTLQSLSEEQPDSLALGRVGGISTIVDSIAPFQGSFAINELGTSTLYNLSKLPHNHSILASANAVPLLVRIMNTYPTHASIQRHSILTLGNVAKYNIDYKILICEEGGMMAIMKAVEAFGHEGQRGDDQVQGEEGESVSEAVLRAAYWSLRRLGMPRLRGLTSENSGEESDGEEGIGMDLFE